MKNIISILEQIAKPYDYDPYAEDDSILIDKMSNLAQEALKTIKEPKLKVSWNKITKTRLPPENKKVLLYGKNNVLFAAILKNTKYRGYVDNGWTHWAILNLPEDPHE